MQDNCVIHGETVLGPRCRMGHGAVVHGAALGEGVLVAMNAVVLDGVRLGSGVVVAAGSVVAPKAEVEDRKVVMGVPGAVVGDLPPGMQRAGKTRTTCRRSRCTGTYRLKCQSKIAGKLIKESGVECRIRK